MGIISKAIRKAQAGPAQPAIEETPQKTLAGSDKPASGPSPAAPPPEMALLRPSPQPAPSEAVSEKLQELPAERPSSRNAAGTSLQAAASGLSPQPGTRRTVSERQPPARPEAGHVALDLVSLVNPEGPEAELFKLLRTRILFPQSGHPPRTILVTSALAEEGKSFVAANLAVNIARNVDEHVLLVDCDLRKPSIHTKFGFNGVKGLSEYLASGLELPSLLIKTGVEKLTLLPSGAPPANPSELISSSKMAGLIEELKARYDDRYIILDSPPPMMAPETSAIAKWADGILVVVKYGTPMNLVEDLVAQLDREKIIGVVINRVHQREFQRYSYKKYYAKSKYYSS